MKTEKQLAIVIPAYKKDYFEQALNSIAGQSCRDFTLYIGDDASPSDLYSIVSTYENEIDIVYKRFDQNLGGKNLVSHWERCIEMVQGEQWIWLFSDDDIMEKTCVELFYNQIEADPISSLLHFDITIIGKDGKQLYKEKTFENHLTSSEYFSKVITQKVHSCVVEYIFRRDLFIQEGGFVNFDLAWSSDTATWMQLSRINGIKTIKGAKVNWRMSQSNISSKSGDKEIVLRKTRAAAGFLNWSKSFFQQNGLNDITSSLEKFYWLLIGIVYTDTMSYKEKFDLIQINLRELNEQNLLIRVIPVWILEEAKRKIKTILTSN